MHAMRKMILCLLLAGVAADAAGAVDCCSWDNCGECGDTTAYCNSFASACEGDCDGVWCPGSDDDDDDDDDDVGNVTEYCPYLDMWLEGGVVAFSDGGWSIRGDGRVSSKTSWNLLGGSLELVMDVRGVQPGVNTNFYTTHRCGVSLLFVGTCIVCII